MTAEHVDSFGRALSHLRNAFACGPDALSPLEADGALRRFEHCLDAGWQAAREFLENSGVRIAPITPREIIRQAVAARVIDNAQVWIAMFDHRNLLAHNHGGAAVAEVVQAVATRYLPAMEELAQKLSPQESATNV